MNIVKQLRTPIYLFKNPSPEFKRHSSILKMATQTALALTEIEKPLTKITLPVPMAADLKQDELLIKITAAGRKYFNYTNFPGDNLRF